MSNSRALIARPPMLGAVAAALALAACPTAHASAPGAPGLVNVEARYTVSATVEDSDPTPGTPRDRHVASQDFQRGDGVASVRSPGWPALPGGPGTGPSACTEDCGSADAVAAAQVDAGGLLASDARSLAGVSAGTGRANASAHAQVNLNDTITLSKAATVVLRGRVRATLDRVNDGPGDGGPEGRLDVALVFGGCQDGECPPVEQVGFLRQYEPPLRSSLGGTPKTVDESFAVPVALPAGESTFNAQLVSRVAAGVRGVLRPGGDSQSARADAMPNDDGDRVEFSIEVPADVVASSGSGRLAIVGGVPPQPPSESVEQQLAKLRASVAALPVVARLLLAPFARRATCESMSGLAGSVALLRAIRLLAAADADDLVLRARRIRAVLGC